MEKNWLCRLVQSVLHPSGRCCLSGARSLGRCLEEEQERTRVAEQVLWERGWLFDSNTEISSLLKRKREAVKLLSPTPTIRTSAAITFPLLSTTSFTCRRTRGPWDNSVPPCFLMFVSKCVFRFDLAVDTSDLGHIIVHVEFHILLRQHLQGQQSLNWTCR